MRNAADWEAVIKRVAPGGKPSIIHGLAEALSAGLCDRYAIDTIARQAHFLAQLAHESDGLRTTVEYATGAAYEGRKDLGNTVKGDGRRFKGRGLIQLTGRFNYGKAGEALNEPFLSDPERVAAFPWAAEVSAWFWATHKVNQHADADDVKAVTRAINGGLTGLKSREAYLNAAKTALA
jgi:putative chitinase